jgi:hypothetical protein
MPRIRKITMTVICFEDDVEDVKKSLFDEENGEGWFYESDCPLTNVKVEVTEPTPEEDEKARDGIDELDMDGGSEEDDDRSIAVQEAGDGVQETSNQIFVIRPHKWHGQVVFDDPARGLEREPFVAGVPEMLEVAAVQAGVENPDDGFVLLFSDEPWPGANISLDWQREELGGNVYAWNGMEGWFCPALGRYYPSPPKHLYAQVKA